MPRASSNSGADRVRKAQAAAAAAAVAHAPPAVVQPPPRPSPVPSARSSKAVSRASPRAPPSEKGGAGGGRVAISAGLANLQLAEESQKKYRASTPGPQNGGAKGRKAVGSGGRGRKVIEEEEEEEEEEIEEAEEKVEERKVSPPPVKRSPKVSEGKKAKEVVKAPVVEEAEAEEEETEAEETEAEEEAEAEEEEEEEGEVEFNPPPPPQPRPKLGSKAAASTAAAAASALKPTLQVSPPLTPGTRQGVLAEESGKRSLWVGGALVLVAVVVYTVMHGLPHSLSIPPMEATLSRAVATLRACRGAMDCGNPLPPGSPLACVFTPVQLLQQGGGTEGGSDGGVDLGSVEPFLRGLEGRLGAGVNISQPLSSLSNITIPSGMGSTPLLSWCSIKKGVGLGLWAILDWVWWVITHHPLPTLIGGAGAALVWRVSQARTAAAARALLEERVERYQLFCEAMLMQVDERGGYPWFPLPTLRDAAIGVVTDGVSGELLGGGEREALKKEWGRVEEKLKGDGRFEVGAYLPHAGGVQQLGIRCVVPPTAAPQQLQQLRMRAESRGRKR